MVVDLYHGLQCYMLIHLPPFSQIKKDQCRSDYTTVHPRTAPSALCSLPFLLSLLPLVSGITLLLDPSGWVMWITIFPYMQTMLFFSYHNQRNQVLFCWILLEHLVTRLTGGMNSCHWALITTLNFCIISHTKLQTG